MKKIAQIITVITFVGFLSFLGYKTLTSEQTSYSYYEFRDLTLRPDITKETLTNGEYARSFEAYFQDQFYKRIGLSTYFYKLQFTLNKPVISTALIGDNSWAISEPSRIVNSQPSIDESLKEIKELNDFAIENNIPLYLSISPNKDYILSSLFPSHPDEDEGIEIKNKVLKNLDPNVKVINNVDYFEESFSLEELKEMYYKTDHHWNYLGAYHNYYNLVGELHSLHPEIPSPLKENELIELCADRDSTFFLGSTNRSVLRVLDESDEAVCTYSVDLENTFSEAYAIDLNGEKTNKVFHSGLDAPNITYSGLSTDDHSEIVIKTKNPPNNLNVLVIKDSYTNAMFPHLATHFNETHVLDMRRYEDGSAYEYIKENNINFIILSHRDTMIGGAFKYSGMEK